MEVREGNVTDKTNYADNLNVRSISTVHQHDVVMQTLCGKGKDSTAQKVHNRSRIHIKNYTQSEGLKRGE
jgi:hypothetical protein